MALEGRIEDVDLLSKDIHAHMYEFYDRLHDERPVYKMPTTGIYMLTRYDDVRAALGNPEVFSNAVPFGPLQGKRAQIYLDELAKEGWPRLMVLQATDRPEHERYRKHLDRVFNAKRVQELALRIQEVADFAVDQFIDRGECEFIKDFTIPFPSIVVSEQLGFDSTEIEMFKAWSDNLALLNRGIMTDDEMRAAAKVEAEMQHHIMRIAKDRRKNPRNDFVSRLLEEDPDNAPLTDAEFLSVMAVLVAGGYGTVTNAMANALYLLLTHPDQMAKMRANPDLIRNFVEEALRVETSVLHILRITKRDVEIRGTAIPKGSFVSMRFSAANHDANKFPCPHMFDVERPGASAHLSFGSGPHICPGRVLARQEMASGFSTILRRMSRIEFGRPLDDPPFEPSFNHRTLKELPIRFTKA